MLFVEPTEQPGTANAQSPRCFGAIAVCCFDRLLDQSMLVPLNGVVE